MGDAVIGWGWYEPKGFRDAQLDPENNEGERVRILHVSRRRAVIAIRSTGAIITTPLIVEGMRDNFTKGKCPTLRLGRDETINERRWMGAGEDFANAPTES